MKKSNARKDKARYLDPQYNESAPEYILRMWPETEDAMRALLATMRLCYGDVADLDAAAERIDRRVTELEIRNADPEHIGRAREELNLLTLAKSLLCDG